MKLTEQFRPEVDANGHIIITSDYKWSIALQRKDVAAISVSGPPGLKFTINGDPKSKLNILSVNNTGAYELNCNDLNGVDIHTITVYLTPQLAYNYDNNGWPIIVNVAYSPVKPRLK